MERALNKILRPINALLAFIAAFTVALTFYACAKFYTFLPTSDTWIYTDFLAHAAQGHLDIAALLEKHNNAHLIALPKLVYFFDMWLVNGSGRWVMCVSLAALLATASIFIVVISKISTLNKTEKTFLSLLSSIILLSACQVESLLNPANLQWSLLVFSATVMAWFVSLAAEKKSPANIAGVVLGIFLATLTSASILLILVPLGLLCLGRKFVIRTALAVIALTLISLVINQIFFTDRLPLIGAWLENWLKFTVDFLAPPVERLHSTIATTLAGILVLIGLFRLASAAYQTREKEVIFFAFLLWFSLFVIFATGLVRSYSPTAFTFRFVNIGLLFAAAIIPLLFLVLREQKKQQMLLIAVSVLYALLLSYVNVLEAGNFGYGRNHVRLTQVAHALDINDSFVVSAMPGTMWEKIDFETVQANKHKLQNVGAGVYGSEEFKRVGQSINSRGNLTPVACTTRIIKMRRLLPNQAAYKLVGESKTGDDEIMSRVYFVDSEDIIRGYAIPIEPTRNIASNIMQGQQWAGFVNMDKSLQKNATVLYAHNNKQICAGEKIALPEYISYKKKSKTEAAE